MNNLEKEIFSLRKKGLTWLELSKKLNITIAKARYICTEKYDEFGERKTKKDKEEKKNGDRLTITDNEVTWLFTENKPLTIDDIFEKFKLETSTKIDLTEYEVYFFKTESWDVTAWKNGKAEKVRNYLTDVRFRKKKIVQINYEEDKKQLLDICKNYSPIVNIIKSPLSISDKVLLELGVYDPHYGKLSIIDKTGETGSLEGASTMVRNAIVDLVERTKHYNIEVIKFPIGNDWSHIDNAQGTTTKGTLQEYTNYLFQIRRKCKEDLIWAILYLLKVAPVHIITVPGNHDENVILTIAEVLDAYFHNNKNVTVDISPSLRKSFVYGKNYIGLTHGDERDIKIDRLPLVFAQEDKVNWMMAEFHEIHVGHIHIKKEKTFIIGDEFNGIRIRWIPSLASADSWHYRHGFVKSRKSAEAFLWDKEEGMINNFAVNVRM
ncbi:MAG: hypothetical protein WC942_10040 [Clostridia bacterium]|jgi:cell division protein FtsI/penicillin-binding protein 2